MTGFPKPRKRERNPGMFGSRLPTPPRKSCGGSFATGVQADGAGFAVPDDVFELTPSAQSGSFPPGSFPLFGHEVQTGYVIARAIHLKEDLLVTIDTNTSLLPSVGSGQTIELVKD